MGKQGMRWSAVGIGLNGKKGGFKLDGVRWEIVTVWHPVYPGDVVSVNGHRVLAIWVNPDPPMIEPPSPDEKLARFRHEIRQVLFHLDVERVLSELPKVECVFPLWPIRIEGYRGGRR